MIPLAVVAVCMTILIADRMLVLLRERRRSLRFYQQVLDLVKGREFEQAARLAAGTRGVLSRTLKVCLAQRETGLDRLDDAIQETFLHEFPPLERFLPSIAMLASLAPILGLLGTVTGIIRTFDMISAVEAGCRDTRRLEVSRTGPAQERRAGRRHRRAGTRSAPRRAAR